MTFVGGREPVTFAFTNGRQFGEDTGRTGEDSASIIASYSSDESAEFWLLLTFRTILIFLTFLTI